MSYRYSEQKSFVFTDGGQRMFLKIRDFVERAISFSGAVDGGHAIGAAASGSSWEMMACVDRLVELGELREVTTGDCAWQNRVFVR